MNRTNTSNINKDSKQGIYYNHTDKWFDNFDNNFYWKNIVYVNKKESKTTYNHKEADVFFKKMFEKKFFKKKTIKI